MIKLSEKDRKVLLAVHLNADASIPELAKACNLKHHTVRYILDSLLEKKVLQPFLIINRSRIGLKTFVFYFSLSAQGVDNRQNIINDIVSIPWCVWLCPVVGEFDFGCAFSVSSIHQLNTIFENIAAKFGKVITRRIFIVEHTWYYFGRKYIFPGRALAEPICVKESQNHVTLDELDESILREMLQNPLCPEPRLQETLKVPLSTLHERIRKLKKKGVILGVLYGMYYTKAYISAYRILCDFSGCSKATYEKFVTYAKTHDHITACDFCSGTHDLEFSVEFENSNMIGAFIDEFKNHFSKELNSCRVLSLLDDLKWSSAPIQASSRLPSLGE